MVVYKTPDRKLVGQGLAGTIDLRTLRPLDYTSRAMVFNIRGERNSHDDLGADGDDKGYRASFSYVDQFLDDTLGLAIRRRAPRLAAGDAGRGHLRALACQRHADGSQSRRGDQIPASPQTPYITDGIKVRTDMGTNRRDGAMATLQWEPSDSYTSILDMYYTKRKQEDNARSLEVNLGVAIPVRAAMALPRPASTDIRTPRRERHGSRRHAEQPRTARAQFPVHHQGQDFRGRLEQHLQRRANGARRPT